MENWDDLQLVAAIAAGGSLAAAARTLELDYSTVYRRLNALEKGLNARLFERSRAACAATPAGERLVSAALTAREAVDSALLDIAGTDARLGGTIRLTTVGTLAEWVLMPLLAEFRRQNPNIRVELVGSPRALNLTQREADVALRLTDHPPENLVGVAIGRTRSAVYASRAYLDAHPGLAWDALDWIVPTDDAVLPEEARWHRRHVRPEQVAMWVNSGSAGQRAALQDMGLVLLVGYLGDGAGLVRVSRPIAGLDPQLWLLTHPNLRNVARIRAFFDFMKGALADSLPRMRGATSPVDLREPVPDN